jgi:hypothetical protein
LQRCRLESSAVEAARFRRGGGTRGGKHIFLKNSFCSERGFEWEKDRRACKGTDSGSQSWEDWGTIRTVGRRRKQDREGETEDICTHTRVGCAGDAVAPVVTGLRPAVVLPAVGAVARFPWAPLPAPGFLRPPASRGGLRKPGSVLLSSKIFFRWPGGRRSDVATSRVELKILMGSSLRRRSGSQRKVGEL